MSPTVPVWRGESASLISGGDVARLSKRPKRTLVSFTEQLRRATVCYERKQVSVVENLVPVSLFDRASDCTNVGAPRVTGQMRLDKLRKTIASLGVEFTQDQQEFMACIIGALAKLLCKEDLPAMIEDLMADLRTTRLYQEVMGMMGRRDGKTWLVSAVLVAVLCSIENVQAGIFATGRRTAQKLLELVLWFIGKLGNCRIKKCNAETVWLQGDTSPNDVRKVSAYPSNVRISSIDFCLFFFCFLFFFGLFVAFYLQNRIGRKKASGWKGIEGGVGLGG